MKLSEKIYLYRKQSGKSQEQLAELMGVSRQAVSKWETGDAEPESNKLVLLAECMDVTVDFLLSDKEEFTASHKDKKPEKNTSSMQSSFSKINWVYPIYLIMLLLWLCIFICFDGGYIYLANLRNFIDLTAFTCVMLGCLLLLFVCGLLKPLVQAFGWMFCKKKVNPDNISLYRQAIHTAIGGCLLGNLLYGITTFCNMLGVVDIYDSWMIIRALLAVNFCSILYCLIAVLILLPISIRLKQQIK